MENFYESKNIIRIEDKQKKELKDYVVKESFYEVIINKKRKFTLSCSPVKIKELILGRLFSEGLVYNYSQIKEINIRSNKIEVVLNKIDDQEKKENINNENDKYNKEKNKSIDKIINKKFNNKIKANIVFNIIEELSNRSEVFKKTGGVHNAILSDNVGNIITFREDIGRHNTVDKIIAYILKNEINIENKVLAISSRISAEIVKKVANINIPIIISQSPPSTKAINIAQKEAITIIGFVRKRRMNIYTSEKRVIYP